MALKTVRFVNMLLTSLVSGIYVRDLLGAPAVKELTASAYTQYQQSNGRLFTRIVPTLGLAVTVSGATLLVLNRSARTVRSAYALLALACNLAQTSITMRQTVPIDREIKTWSPESLPNWWPDLRDRWARNHRQRTLLALAGLSFQILAVVSARPVRSEARSAQSS